MIPIFMFAVAASVTPITKVIVYPDRAEVLRQVEVACGSRREQRFAGIPPAADPSSFRASLIGATGSIDGQRAELVTRASAYAPEVEALDKKIEVAQDQLAELDDGLRRANNLDSLGGSYAQIATQLIQREMVEGTNAKAWSAALDSTLKATLDAAAERTRLGTKRRTAARELDALQRRRSTLSVASARNEWQVDALVSCTPGKRATVQLSYIVGGARWTPSYEARSLGDKIELSTFATVSQATGEDWSHAELVLSTALPRKDATPPTPQPLRVWADSRQPPRKVLTTRESFVEHAEEAKEEKKQSTTPAQDVRKLAVSNQGVSVQIRVPEPADVHGDGTPTRVQIDALKLAAQLHLRIAARQYPFAFRVAELTNRAAYPLLAGPVDVFTRGELLARYDLDEVAIGGRFSLTFGVEERVKVDRSTLAEGTRDRSVTGLSRRRQFSYRIDVANFLGSAQDIEVTEQVPVSELDDVKVSVDKATSGGYALDPSDGLLVWKVKLNPGERRPLTLRFAVDVPASYDADGT
jgi:uncharacterized protein (TIGR02231 family)